MSFVFVFCFKQKTAYELRISDWSSDVCSSDLEHRIDNRRSLGGRIMDHVAGGEGRLVEKRADLGATGTGARLLDNVSRSIERRVMGSHESTPSFIHLRTTDKRVIRLRQWRPDDNR